MRDTFIFYFSLSFCDAKWRANILAELGPQAFRERHCLWKVLFLTGEEIRVGSKNAHMKTNDDDIWQQKSMA